MNGVTETDRNKQRDGKTEKGATGETEKQKQIKKQKLVKEQIKKQKWVNKQKKKYIIRNILVKQIQTEVNNH